MNVKNISLNCRKPRQFGNNVSPETATGKKPYKHFEQMDDDTLMLKSVLKAHNEVEKSNKSKLFKAMPAIATGILGATFALTHPGKLSGKVATGVGFLVAANVTDKISEKADSLVKNNWKTDNKTPRAKVEKAAVETGLTITGAALALTGIAYATSSLVGAVKKSPSKLAQALTNDGQKLIKEINSSKVGNFVSEKIMPLEAKHTKAINATRILAPFGAVALYSGVQNKLIDGMSKDIKEKSAFNFAKGKLIQEAARKEFDKIDAEEV